MLFIVFISYLVSIGFTILAFFKRNIKQLKWFCFLLVFILIAELSRYLLIGSVSYKVLILHGNISIYTEFLIYYILYIQLLKGPKRIRIASTLLFLFLLGSLLNSIFLESVFELQSFSYILGTLGIFVLIMMYFFEMLNRLKSSEKFYTNYWFWISAGLFILLATEMPYIAFLKHSLENNIQPNENWIISKYMINIIYYSIFIPTAFLCSKK